MNISSEHIFCFLFLFLSYLFCSIPFGKILSQKVAGIDITQRGSGNIGATNVARELGFKWGMLTLLLDALKGFIPITLFGLLLPDIEVVKSIVGLASLLGHQFSIFQKFRGGKGVATALGIYLSLSPFNCFIALLLFIFVVYVSDFVSLGSILSASLIPFLLLLSGDSKTTIINALIMAALICLKHKDNIERLVAGKERRLRKNITKSEAQEDDPILPQNKNG